MTGPSRDQVLNRDGNRGDFDRDRDRGDQVIDRDRDRGDRDGRHDHDHGDRDRDNRRFGRFFFRPGFGWWYWAWNPSLGRYYQYYDRSYTGGGYNYPAYAYETTPATPQAVLGVTFNPNLSGGAYVNQVVAGGSAEQAGIQPGDVIVAVYGSPITNYAEVVDLVAQSRPGDTMQIELLRGGQRLTVNAILAGR